MAEHRGPAARTTSTFRVRSDLPRGSYNVRALATDRAGNPQSRAVAGKLRVR